MDFSLRTYSTCHTHSTYRRAVCSSRLVLDNHPGTYCHTRIGRIFCQGCFPGRCFDSHESLQVLSVWTLQKRLGRKKRNLLHIGCRRDDSLVLPCCCPSIRDLGRGLLSVVHFGMIGRRGPGEVRRWCQRRTSKKGIGS